MSLRVKNQTVKRTYLLVIWKYWWWVSYES